MSEAEQAIANKIADWLEDSRHADMGDHKGDSHDRYGLVIQDRIEELRDGSWRNDS